MERWRRGPWAKECRGPPEGGKGKVINFYPELPEGTRATDTLISPQWNSFWTSDFQNCEMINVCCLSHRLCGLASAATGNGCGFSEVVRQASWGAEVLPPTPPRGARRRQLPPLFHSQLPPFLRTAHLPRIAFAIFPLGNISISVLWSVMSTRPFLQTLSSRKRRWISSHLQRVNTGSVYWRIFSSKYMVFNMSVTYWVFITALNGGKDPASNLVLFCWGQHLALWDTHVPGHCLYVATGLYSLKINWANFNHYGEKSHSQPSARHSLLIYDGWVNQRVVMWTAIQKAWLPGCCSRLQRLEAQRWGLGKVG